MATKSGDPISISENVRFIAVKTKILLFQFSFNRDNFTISGFSTNLGEEFRSFLQVSSFNPAFRCHNKVGVSNTEDSRASCGDFDSITGDFVWDSTVFRGGKLLEFLSLSFIGNSGFLVDASRVTFIVRGSKSRNALTVGTRNGNAVGGGRVARTIANRGPLLKGESSTRASDLCGGCGTKNGGVDAIARLDSTPL